MTIEPEWTKGRSLAKAPTIANLSTLVGVYAIKFIVEDQRGVSRLGSGFGTRPRSGFGVGVRVGFRGRDWVLGLRSWSWSGLGVGSWLGFGMGSMSGFRTKVGFWDEDRDQVSASWSGFGTEDLVTG
ncbi:hypothetical protein TIFTF001_029738 [Ficus carica]|uniref:Uncharacterized protein n=1 Tax=Ficus carica TaxID=3494 RepID=A0AA88DSC6_FICCA|nr:hypothetical protein TIFTF001_029738 [Ficus carica]